MSTYEKDIEEAVKKSCSWDLSPVTDNLSEDDITSNYIYIL